MKKKISTIIFGLRNILLHIEKIDLHRFVVEKLGITDYKKSQIIEDWISQYERGEISTELFLNGLIKESKHPVQALDLIRMWNHVLIEIPEEIPPLIHNLKKKYKIFLIANTNPLHIHWITDHLKNRFDISGFDTHWVDGVFFSHLLGLQIPNPTFYSIVQEEIAIPPEQILLIDICHENLKAAHRAGWNTQDHLLHEPLTSTLQKSGVL